MANHNPQQGYAPVDKRIYSLMKWIMPLFLFTLLVISWIAVLGSNQWISEEIINKQLSIAQLTSNNINYRLASLKNETTSLMMSIYPYLVSVEAQDYEEYNNISKQLSSHDLTGSKLRIYVPDEKIYSSQKDLFFPLSSIHDDNILKEHASYIGISWIETSSIRLETNTYEDMMGCMLTMARTDDYNKLAGSLVLYISVEDLMQTTASDYKEDEEVFLVNQSGKVLASNNTMLIEASPLSREELAFLESSDSGSDLIGNKLFAFCKLGNNEWYLIVRSPSSTTSIGNTATLIRLLIWSLSLLAIGLVVIVLVNNILLHRTFTSIMNAVQRLAEQNHKKNEKAIKHNIDDLGLFFAKITNYRLLENALLIVSKISESIETRYKEKLELADYQMQSLQAQIKPHFLYNTLDIIKWMIVSGEYNDSISTINALSRYLRMSISDKSNIVTLNDEVLLGKTYLEIIERRFRNRFKTSFDLDPVSLECLIPKFIMQPIIENSLIHGILYCKKSNLSLNVRSWIDSDQLVIEIEDNGNGMSKDTLELLRNDAIESKEGYGLKNTRTRLKLFNGKDAGFDIQSVESIGTCITISITARYPIENLSKSNNSAMSF